MKITELLKQDSIQLNDGDILAPITRSEGYVPTYKETDSVHFGQYLYKVLVTGDSIEVVPLVKSEDGKSFVVDKDNPVVKQTGENIYYVTGRNHPEFKDGYHGREYHREPIAQGKEARSVLVAFLEFATQEYSMGVNEFMLASPDYLKAEVPTPPEEEGGDGA